MSHGSTPLRPEQGMLAQRFRRRSMLGLAAGAIAATSAGIGTGSQATQAAPAVLQGNGKLTYWSIITFSSETDQLQVDAINAWGEENGVETEVVVINGNEMNQRVAAAVESGTMPDALDMTADLALLLSNTGQLAPLDDLFETIGGAHGGWLQGIADATNPELFGGSRVGVPYGTLGNILFRRTDLLTEAGIESAPTTWQEVKDAAEATTTDRVFGMGFALSNVGDANIHVQMIQSWGGRVADDEGVNCTIKSPETQAYLEWVTDAFEKDLFPPGVTTWDGAGDNNGYQSGQLVFIANTGSVSVWLDENDPELAAATAFTALPSGPVMRVSPFNVNMRTIPAGGENIDAAKSLIEHLANRDFMNSYFTDGVFGPVLQEQLEFEAFQAPVQAALADLSQNGTPPAFPDVNNSAYAEFNSNFLVPRMIQRIVVDGMSVEDAMDEAQEQGQAIYDKYK